MNDHGHDSKLQQWLTEEYYQVEDEYDQKEKNWEQIVGRLKRERPKRKYRSLFTAVSIFFICLIGTVFLYASDMQAFGWITKYFIQEQGEVTQITNSSHDPSMEPNQVDKEFSNINVSKNKIENRQMSWSKAQQITDFDLHQPSKLLDNFSLDQVVVYYHQENHIQRVQQNYMSDDEQYLMVEQSAPGESLSNSQIIDNQDTSVEKIEINHYQATLTLYKEEFYQVEWQDHTFHWRMEGNISRDKILSIARSIH
ncbi:hypothetical protein J416_02159 [Gracilibacillus halophilus YIM-C55.5]|uniref:DUF4367 domain-containing protein n=1 Tax=Gracilibacillus halophilus YIM-C55.5 TaxID=1308866 RepID=N4WFG3_9BACI|nr:DUF4367 domain-containing protein [Gracilibacillus halophilus]ENH98009.1 hypothetical protein J416_02159 [Gracilibacillus halophilus YIM-C55.5]